MTGDFDADLLLVPSTEATFNIGGRCTTRLTLATHWKQGAGAARTISDLDATALGDSLSGSLSPPPAFEPLQVDEVFERVARGEWTVTLDSESG